MKPISKEFNPANKRSVENFHLVLEFILDEAIDQDEVAQRVLGPKTRRALEGLAKGIEVPESGKLHPDLIGLINEKLTRKKYHEKIHVTALHKKLKMLGKKKFIKLTLAESEVKSQEIGPSTRAFLKAFQKKYKLPETGRVDAGTDERLESLITSIMGSKPRPKKILKTKKPSELSRNVHYLRLNMKSEKVQKLQKNLSWLGYKIYEAEYNSQVYGKTTRNAVKQFQSDRVLPLTGRVDSNTARALNAELAKANPQFIRCDRYRVRGSVRDELWKGKRRVTVRIYAKGLRDNHILLGEQKTFDNGFYDILYSPPQDPVTKRPKTPLHIIVKIVDSAGGEVDSKTCYKVNKVHWVNFTEGPDRYLGPSEYERLMRALKPQLEAANLKIEDLEQSDTQQDIILLYRETDILPQDIMRLSLSNRIANEIDRRSSLPASVFYAFLRQHLPPETPGDFFPDEAHEWHEWIPRLVSTLANGIIFLENDVQQDALDCAFKHNYLPHALKPERDHITRALDALREDYVLAKPLLVGDGTLKALLDASKIDAARYSGVVRTFIKHQGINEPFWKELECDGSITQEALKDFQATMNLGVIANNHLPTLQVLKAKLENTEESKFQAPRDFAKLSLNEWGDLIDNGGGGVPANIDGENRSERAKKFAVTMKSQAERLFPAVALVAEIGRNAAHSLRNIVEISHFMDDTEAFKLGVDNIEKMNIANGSPLSSAAVQEAKVIQRIHRIAPSAMVGVALLNAKLHSSMQIYFYGQDRLIETLEPMGIQRAEILRVFQYAEHQYAQTLSYILRYRFDFLFDNPQVLHNAIYTPDEIERFQGDIPNIELLFGSVDYCDCGHCESLYSPAAYLTDLLGFLEEKDAVESGRSVRDILFDRRPDVGNIKLNCENTDTPLPYIDLVNEILENAIPPTDSDFSYQTSLKAEELRAIPENVRSHSYNELKIANFPMSICFNLWQEATRMFLEHLGVPRHQLMEDLQNRSDTSSKTPSDVDIAAEYFGISSQEQAIILPTTSEANPAMQNEYWGFDDANRSTISVATFLEKSKLTYHQMLNLLQVKFVNPELNRCEIGPLSDHCDADKQTLGNLTLVKLDRMHRFLRLWRRCPWAMWELDLLIRNPKVGNAALDGDCIAALRQFHLLQKELALSAEELLGFFGPINTERRESSDAIGKETLPLYHRLFLNVSVTNPEHPRFKLPIPEGPDLIDSYHRAVILSALAITDQDIEVLAPLTDGKLSLNSLSILYRYTTFAKKLGLSIKDFIQLQNITGMEDPFATLSQSQEMLKPCKVIEAAGFSAAQLNYVLNFDPDSPAGLREEVIIQYLELLRASLISLKNDLFKSNDTHVQLLEKHLSKIQKFNDPDDISRAIDLIEGKWNGDEVSHEAFIDEYFAVFIPDSANPKTILTLVNYHDGDRLTDLEENAIVTRYNFVLQYLYPYLNANLITEHVASCLGLSNQYAGILMEKMHLEGSPLTLREHLQAEALIDQDTDGKFINPLDCTTFTEICLVYHLVHKQSLLLEAFDLKPKELCWFIDHHAIIQTLDLESLAVSGSSPASLFEKWANWWRFLEFKNQFPEPEEVNFYDILEAATDGASDIDVLLGNLATLTQWEPANLKALYLGLGLRHGAGVGERDFIQAETYLRLSKCMQHIRRTGVNAETLLEWTDRSNADQDQSIAEATRRASKAKYDVNEWLGKVQPIEDELREKKRDALAAFLIEQSQRSEPKTVTYRGEEIPNPKYWRRTNDLYRYFLIDVDMSACQLTSRIKQAISSVQLFIQRCLLNLEARYVKVPKDDPDLLNSWQHWKWMQHYRVWEANRKVFLYPENWIEPELRDDKSPFFKELEDEILQKEITHEHVEQAFLNYLSKVDEVAHLDVVGTYHDFHGPKAQVHVIARTKNFPHTYYHRIYDLDYSFWSPWEKIEVDITGDHAIPVVYNRKLYLFWLKIEKKPLKIAKSPPARTSDSPTDSPEAAKFLEIQLAWSVRTSNGWSPRAMSTKKLIHPWDRPAFAYHIKPRHKESDNTLWIDLFISTTNEFNNALFYDQFMAAKVEKTRVRFNETYRPWHSSSFVFNGNVTAVKLRGIKANYSVLNDQRTEYITAYISSFQYVHDSFEEEGRIIQELLPAERSYGLMLPTGMHFEYNRLTNNEIHNPNSSRLRVTQEGLGKKTILQNAKCPFEAVSPMQSLVRRPFFYQDSERAFFLKPEGQILLADYQTKMTIARYVAYPFYHPYTELFIRELNRSGLDGLLNRNIQTRPERFFPKNTFNFNNTYSPVAPHGPDLTAQKDTVDFSFGGAYSVYNWEMFFHAPMLIAGKLSQNQRFEEASRWYHYVFDPTNTENLSVPQRYWVTKPFYEHSDVDYRQQRIQNLIEKINEFEDQVKAWKNNPFSPHLIASYRSVAYQRSVVMKYIDNLIAWGDQLFRQDTLESINQASLRYMLAYELLGDRPKRVPALRRKDKTYNQLRQEEELDIFRNCKVGVAIENEIPLPAKVPPSEGTDPLPRVDTLYFCVPRNDQLITYWDTVEDRFFKIRNCMNIEGIVRQLPLFAPPIDPALLVKAAAAGLDLGSVLNDLSVQNPCYRFGPLLQTALQFCSEVKALGEKLLAILEKKDAEALATLRSSHGIELMEAIKAVMDLQVDEANENILALDASKNIAEERRIYYEGVPYMMDREKTASDLHYSTIATDSTALSLNLAAAILHLIPNAEVGAEGVGGTPRATIQFGGHNLAQSLSSFAAMAQNIGSILRTTANQLENKASYSRRDNENQLQMRLAEKEKLQIERQKLAAEIRKQIAETEQENQQLQIDNAKAEHDYFKNKYTNEQLYNWMLTQVSSVYFQAYQMAYDMAKRAEKSYRYELALQDSTYIQFGYWDSLKKGLLAGDKLMNGLRRMQAAYFDQNKRELEITKHISLAQVSPWHLMQLKMTGQCTLELPEWLFDMDYPGHYMRRIKTISVTIPCVAGPYTGIHCTLFLHSSRIRVSNLVGSNYEMTDVSDDRFRHEYGTIQSIATSHGKNDSGTFQLNFSDERFLPFEGAGVLSTWGISMPQVNNQFDFSTISDFIIHMQYTARDGGTNLAFAAQELVDSVLPQKGALLISAKHQFPTEWQHFLHPSQTGADQKLKMNLGSQHYPFYARNAANLQVSKINLIITGHHSSAYRMQIRLPGQPVADELDITKDTDLNNVHHKEYEIASLPNGHGEWGLKIRRAGDDGDTDFKSLPADNISDLLMVIHFQIS